MTATMRHRHPRRWAGAVVVTALAAVTGLVTVYNGLEQEGFTLPARETIVKEYPVIPAQEPVTVTVGGVVGPDECELLPSCALVTFEVERPMLSEGDDFYMVLTISFEAETISDNNIQPLKTNDLDVYLFDDGQTAEAEGSSGYTEIGSSASGDNPEIIRVYEPLLGTYNLVVQNFEGANTGWVLTAESIVGEFTSPFEALAPVIGQGSHNVTKPTTPRPTTTTVAQTTSTVSIPEGVVLPDDDFEGGEFDPTAGVDNQVAAEDMISALRAGGIDDSPSALSVVLWMVFVPVLLIGSIFLLLAAKRRGIQLRRRAAAEAS